MGSGISTKYEKTYFFSKGSNFNFYEEKEESEKDWFVAEDSPKYNAGNDTHTIESDNPMETAMDFYSNISEGGATGYLENHHGIETKLGDGTVTYFRPYPKTEGSPVVEIKINFERIPHKIHFIKR